MGNGEQDGSFSADTVYTITELASKIGVSEKWVRQRMIDNGTCAHKKCGNTYFFLGKWIINWCLADHEIPSRDGTGETESRTPVKRKRSERERP